MPDEPFSPSDPLTNDVPAANAGGNDQQSGAEAGDEALATAPVVTEDVAPNAGPLEMHAEQFATAITGNVVCPQMVKVFAGYAGQSDCPGWWRLYSSLEFNEYIEFAMADVVNATKFVEYGGARVASTVWPPITRTVVWIKAGSIVRLGRLQAFTVESDFLRGRVTHDSDLDAFSVGQGGQTATGLGSSPAGNFSSRGPC